MEKTIFVDRMKGIERLEIGDGCCKRMAPFLIDGWPWLRSIFIGEKNFISTYGYDVIREFAICNCDRLNKIHIGNHSFERYLSFELKNLPSLETVELCNYAFEFFKTAIFEGVSS